MLVVFFFFQLKMTYHELTVFRINFRKKGLVVVACEKA